MWEGIKSEIMVMIPKRKRKLIKASLIIRILLPAKHFNGDKINKDAPHNKY